MLGGGVWGAGALSKQRHASIVGLKCQDVLPTQRTRLITVPASIALAVSRLLQGRLNVAAKDCILKGGSMLRSAVNTIALRSIWMT